MSRGSRAGQVPRFERSFFFSGRPFARMGEGELGGKAGGLVRIQDVLESMPGRSPQIEVSIPTMAVVTTDRFDAFMERNVLYDLALSNMPDERIAHAFQKADLPADLVGDLKGLIDEVNTPLAVRSSSLLEDALGRPFAGVYATKMIPNNQPDPGIRFRRLVEAIKFVYASTFFKTAKDYIRSTECDPRSEKMAVVIQEVVGCRHGERFYPHLSGVGRSYNFYPIGVGLAADGVVSLALGLGKTIVEGEICWSYSPARPKAPPPFGSVEDMLENTQLEFWAVNMGKPPAYDPIAEAEYLLKADLAAAEYDDVLRYAASTYDARADRLTPGTGRAGTRVVNFAPLLVLEEIPLNGLIRTMLAVCEESAGTPVEIEFAITFDTERKARVGFLQVRPMMVSGDRVDLAEEELNRPGTLVSSDKVMGNGIDRSIADVVYVKPDSFETRFTPRIALEIEQMNRALLAEARPYLLIGFGRWGSRDSWLGIPTDWGQISGARAIVEATRPGLVIEPSQGSHFFHNVTSARVSYFWVHHDRAKGVDWEWLDSLEAFRETELVRHVRLEQPLLVRVDGRSGRGGVWFAKNPLARP